MRAQTEKPQNLVDAENFIKENEPKIPKMNKRINYLNEQRPEIVYSGNQKALSTHEEKLKEANKDLQDLKDKIAGAYKEVERAAKQWLEQEKENLNNEVKQMENEVSRIEKETEKYRKKIEEVQNKNVSLMFGGNGSRTDKLREQIKIHKRGSIVDDFQKDILRSIEVDVSEDIWL